MHIGLDARLTYYTGGGISRYIRQLASRLPALDPANRYTIFQRGGHAETLSPTGTRADLLTPAHHRLERLFLGVELAPRRLDLLHSPDFIPPMFGVRRRVITVHDLTFLLYPDFLTAESRRYYNAQIKGAVSRADHISADSAATRDDLIRHLDVRPEKITVIHLACGPEFRPLHEQQVSPVLERWALPRGYILFVGTFEPRKNVPGLLEAYARFRQRRPDAPPLTLAGRQGWLFESALTRIQELGLDDHVRLLMELPEADLPAVYNGAGLFVLPSHYEGFGVTLLEAMACGVPALAAGRASLPEIAGGAAVLVNPDDSEEMAEQLERVLTDTVLRQSLRERGLERASQFSWERCATQTATLYREVLEG